MVTKEAPQINGAIFIDLNNGVVDEIVRGSSYRKNQDKLIGLAIDLDSRWLHSKAAAEVMMPKNMSVEGRVKDIEIPSIQLFRKEGTPIGFTTARVFLMQTISGKETPLLYISNRAFDEQYRGMHLGRVSIQIARTVHGEARWMAHRTQSEVAAYSVLQADVYNPRRVFPWNARYYTDLTAQKLMTDLFYAVHVNGQTVDMSTGVSIGDYIEPNWVNRINPEHAPTVEIRRRMTEEFGMDFARGDSLYIVGELK